jgi:MtrB/PioB family decaheme-associated outer membrane protein
MTNKMQVNWKLLPLAAALALAYGTALAQEGEVAAMISPNTESVSVGAAGTNGAANLHRLGQYTGLNKDGAVLLDFEKLSREEESGTWTRISGRDLGLDTRELGFSTEKQGAWRIGADWNEIVRNDPYVINTGMTGIGTTTPTINLIKLPSMPAAWATGNGLSGSALSGHDEQLQLKRTSLGLAGEAWISPEMQLEVNLRTEKKQGARMFGRVGINSGDMAQVTSIGSGAANGLGNWALLLTPEPIDSTIQTIEAKLNYNHDKLALSGGYYGSYYVNSNTALTPNAPGTLNRGVLWNGTTGGARTIQDLLNSSVALPPDNQAHQLYLSGTYAYTDTLRTNFKLAFTHATQDENFVGAGLTPSATAPASLGGVVDTTLAQLGLTARPIKNLSLNASLRYEDRVDNTPIYVYNYGGSPNTNGTTNWPSGSQRRLDAKFDGVYRLPEGYSVLAGLDWEHKTTPLPPTGTAIVGPSSTAATAAGQVYFRESLDESGIHGTLRKAMSETVNGSVGLEFKQRRSGDPWITGSLSSTGASPYGPLVVGNPALLNAVLSDMYMDRDRTKARGTLDWDATDDLSLQLVAEHGQDDYKRDFPTVSNQTVTINAGARVVTNDSLTLDSTYKINSLWQLSAYWTHGEARWKVNKANIGDDTFNTNDTLGVNLKGKLGAQWTVGLDATVTADETRFNNLVVTTSGFVVSTNGNIPGWNGSTPPGNYLPNIHYDIAKLNLYGIYEIDKKSFVRVNAIYQEFKTDDWQWGYNGVPFLYSDNTTVSNPNQFATFLGVSFTRKF